MHWALVVAIAWVVLLVPAGLLLGRALRRADARDAAEDDARAGRGTAPPPGAAPARPDLREPSDGAPLDDHRV